MKLRAIGAPSIAVSSSPNGRSSSRLGRTGLADRAAASLSPSSAPRGPLQSFTLRVHHRHDERCAEPRRRTAPRTGHRHRPRGRRGARVGRDRSSPGQAICERLSPKFGAENIIARQACFRPLTQDGLPLIGRMPQIEGVYVATGHNVWGILNAPATGEALAELIADGVARSTDLTPFDPTRLKPLDPSLLRSS
jgi:glycine/D-amino acid oxidase-like deaminating enzyme